VRSEERGVRNDIAAPSFEANTERSDFAARQSSVPYMVCENINNVWTSQECMGKQETGDQRSPLQKIYRRQAIP